MKTLNVEAGKLLARKYRSITLEDIHIALRKVAFIEHVAPTLTGYGNKLHCKLCLAVKGYCQYCIYGYKSLDIHPCAKHKTFIALGKRNNTPEDLLKAFKARANYIERLIKKIEG